MESPLFNMLFGALSQVWPIGILVLVTWLLRLPVVKGMLGEWWVNRSLVKKLPQDSYQLFKNVTLPTGDGTTQIDHILLSAYGIFVIETKNMKGWIFGSERRAKWTQQIYRHKTSFQNPLHQNYKHTETLQRLLNLPKDAVHSVVIFTGQAEFKTSMPDNVGHVRASIEFIRSKQKLLLCDEDISHLARLLRDNKLSAGLSTHLNHVRHVKNLVREKRLEETAADNSSRHLSCPRCRGELVQRKNRKSGELFIGCSNFPRCRFITADIN